MAGRLLDTKILIDLSRGYVNAASFIETELKQGTLLYISVISAMELVIGSRNN